MQRSFAKGPSYDTFCWLNHEMTKLWLSNAKYFLRQMLPIKMNLDALRIHEKPKMPWKKSANKISKCPFSLFTNDHEGRNLVLVIAHLFVLQHCSKVGIGLVGLFGLLGANDIIGTEGNNREISQIEGCVGGIHLDPHWTCPKLRQGWIGEDNQDDDANCYHIDPNHPFLDGLQKIRWIKIVWYRQLCCYRVRPCLLKYLSPWREVSSKKLLSLALVSGSVSFLFSKETEILKTPLNMSRTEYHQLYLLLADASFPLTCYSTKTNAHW